ncbi:hypothetical protein NIES4071_24070 [Calothrix sp. NIES-4071]|nr:hypothetical protein NIES4071_24070 [Calothrix sp. NIES-4071]BAZ56730.1 hypothetical protein NIES4105_24010 [Calothrix sp. NIES-4105]
MSHNFSQFLYTLAYAKGAVPLRLNDGTLPHEVGHYVDYLESVIEKAGQDIDEKERLNNLYWAKPKKDKEAFAHRYATEFSECEKKAGHIPFKRILNEEKILAENLNLSWFV